MSRDQTCRDSIQTWAHVVVAVCAIVGIGLGIHSNRQTAGVLARASEAFHAFTYPLVKFHRYHWVNNSNSPNLSCDNPAGGLVLSYRNMSGVPVLIEGTDFQVRMGDREIGADPERVVSPDGQ